MHKLTFDATRFKGIGASHLRRWGWLYALTVLLAAVLPLRFTLGLNATASLPHRLYVIDKHRLPARGDLVAFHWAGGGPYRAGVVFVKILVGLPGDRISRIDRSFFVNDTPVGTAKPHSRTGSPLDAGPTGTLPPDRYYVRATHPDSLDSRYALTGWIDRSQIIGRVHAIF